MTNEETRLDFIEKHAPRALCHYADARAKHPYFCDKIITTDFKDEIRMNLNRCRRIIKDYSRMGIVSWNDILNCEVWEVFDAIANDDKAQAVEELYDCIAVCLRAIDVLEGRQSSGSQRRQNENRHTSV